VPYVYDQYEYGNGDSQVQGHQSLLRDSLLREYNQYHEINDAFFFKLGSIVSQFKDLSELDVKISWTKATANGIKSLVEGVAKVKGLQTLVLEMPYEKFGIQKKVWSSDILVPILKTSQPST